MTSTAPAPVMAIACCAEHPFTGAWCSVIACTGDHSADGDDWTTSPKEDVRFATERAGWPRRHAPCLDDRAGDRPASRPVPWLAQHDDTGHWSAYEFAQDRCEQMRERELCQLCGGRRGDLVYAIASERPDRQHRKLDADFYGGALCSVRCARLTAAACPRYQHMWPVGVYEVPRQPRVDLVGCGEDNDDEYDLTGLTPITVVGRTTPNDNDARRTE